MENTSAAELLQRCLDGVPWTDELLRAALAEQDGRAFFRVVVEGLGDRFEPRLCDVYARLFARVLELHNSELAGADLVQRYERVRQPRVCDRDPKHVYVLSRVTLGADVAVTSIVLDAAKKRFPDSRIHLVGPRKNWEMFADDVRIAHAPFAYPRAGSIEERLSAKLRFDDGDSIVVDPDSRLSQLGLLPVCDEDRYFFFESRAYGGDSDATLVQLTKDWVRETFGIADAQAWVAPQKADIGGDVVVSVGVGENAEKRIEDPFELDLLSALLRQGVRVLVDEGAGGEETERVRRLGQRLPALQLWSGAYAPFAYAISRTKLYVGYDSAGQHVAAASGTRLVSIFAGYPVERMLQRWRPDGQGRVDVVKVTRRDPSAVLESALQYLTL